MTKRAQPILDEAGVDSAVYKGANGKLKKAATYLSRSYMFTREYIRDGCPPRGKDAPGTQSVPYEPTALEKARVCISKATINCEHAIASLMLMAGKQGGMHARFAPEISTLPKHRQGTIAEITDIRQVLTIIEQSISTTENAVGKVRGRIAERARDMCQEAWGMVMDVDTTPLEDRY